MFELGLSLITDSTYLKFLLFAGVLALITYVVTIVTDNCSQIDRAWGFLPTGYAWTFVIIALMRKEATSNVRLVVMAIMITMWGAHIIQTFWRHGYYQPGNEDRRWADVRQTINYPQKKLVFHLIVFFTLAITCNYMLLFLATPVWFVASHAATTFNWLDCVIVLIWLGFFVCAVVADEQQYRFHQQKDLVSNGKSLDLTKVQVEDCKRGFLVRGLFAFARHPNYFGEIMMWWTMAAFSISTQLHKRGSTSYINYTMYGPIMITCALLGTCSLTEKIARKKYAEYADYQREVPRVIPGFKPYQPKAQKAQQ